MTDEPIIDDATVNFVAGPLDHFTVEKAGGGDIGAQLAGTPFDVRVTAQDANDNTVTGFPGPVGFTSNPSGGIPAGATSGAFTNGVLASHSITFGTPGNFTLTATRTAGGTESGTSNQFAIEAPPSAVDDGPSANSVPNDPFHTPFNTTFTLAAPGVMSNDDRGFPEGTVASFGGGDLGGSVTTNAGGSTVAPIPVVSNDDRFAGVAANNNGSLTVNENGSVSFTPPDGFTGVYDFRYRIENTRGTSDAVIRIAVGERPSAAGDTYSPQLVGNVPIDTDTTTDFSVTSNDGGSAKTLTVGTQNNGAAMLRNNVTNSRFKSNVSGAILTTFAGNSTHTVNVSGSRFTDNNMAVQLGAIENADVNFDINGNTVLRSQTNAIQVLAGSGTNAASNYRGSIRNNTIGDGTTDSGARDAFGIALEFNDAADAVVSVTGNNAAAVESFITGQNPCPGVTADATVANGACRKP